VTILPLLALVALQTNPDLERLATAQQLIDSGRCSAAIPILKELRARHPETASLTYGLGRCYFETEDYTAAVAALRQAARMLPGSAEVRFFLGSALGVGGNIPEAIPELRTAMELDPRFQPAYRAFGMFRVQQGLYEQDALQALETAIRLDPRDARALYWMGELHRATGDAAPARQYFERARQLDPEDPLVRLGLGRMSLDDGEVDQALADFDSVLRTAPGLVPALLGRARALYYQGRVEQALAPAEAARQGAGSFEDRRGSVWILCRIYRSLGRDAEARDAERQLKEMEDNLSSELERIRELSGQAARLEADGKPAQAVPLLEALLKIRETSEVQTRLGDAYLKLGRPADAQRCYIRASRIGPLSDELKRRLEKAAAAAGR
jgi:tetratricopeptide (TPR) repeat protein